MDNTPSSSLDKTREIQSKNMHNAFKEDNNGTDPHLNYGVETFAQPLNNRHSEPPNLISSAISEFRF